MTVKTGHGGARRNAGRPPIHGRKMVSLTLHVDAETRVALQNIARATNTSLAQVVRKAISIGISRARTIRQEC